MNQKGIESMPYVLLISIFIILFAVSIFSMQMNDLTSFKEQKEMYDSLQTMIDKMQIMKASSDYGSFNRITLYVPSGHYVRFNEDDKIEVLNEDSVVNTINLKSVYINITKVNSIETLGRGTHEIILQYGGSLKETNHSITFK
ncbi:MAG: hypothetical protein PHW96_01510 [Candidatus Nanoarchaeia archaeon]|nr:hypothetical protein [Candidatus Nanoarchaeia archaeon]